MITTQQKTNQRNRPYIDWRIDLWKTLFLLLLFSLLLAGVLFAPEFLVN